MIDSCWGYYGDDGIEQIIGECQSTIDHEIAERLKKHSVKLKAQIKGKAPMEKREKLSDVLLNDDVYIPSPSEIQRIQ